MSISYDDNYEHLAYIDVILQYFRKNKCLVVETIPRHVIEYKTLGFM